MTDTNFVHLHVHSSFSFLHGADAVETIVRQAAAFGMPALALTDHNNVSGAVRFVRACRQAGIQPIVGCELTLTDGYHLVALTTSPRGYASLCRLLTAAHLENERGNPRVAQRHIAAHRRGLLFLSGGVRGEIASLLYRRRYDEARTVAFRYVDLFGRDNFFLQLEATALPGQHDVNRALVRLAAELGVQTVATGDVYYARRKRHPVHDVLRCIALGITLQQPHRERPFNDQQYVLSPAEMAARFAWHPEAVHNTVAVAARCEPALELDVPRHPAFPVSAGGTADGLLHELTWAGARRRYGHIGGTLQRRIEEELAVIGHLRMADYFLVAWDVVEFARRRGIRSSGRGSAADSVVAYCLGLTAVDAFRRGLAFERFLSIERGEPPDIDIDIEADRRDEVAKYVYERYGRDHVAAVATYNTYRARGAVREVGKVLGLPAAEIDAVAKRMPHIPADAIGQALRHYPELRAVARSADADALRGRWLQLAAALAGLPRHLGTHSSGLVISAQPLTQVTPLQRAAKGVVTSQFDKDDVEALGLMKLDLLFLRVLGAVNTSTVAIQRRDPKFSYDTIPAGDARTYERLRRGETVGAFQLESPAQRALHPRLRPDTFEDIVASVALIRPGPIKGDLVHPYIARRNAEQPVTYVHPKLEPILKKTYGIVLFQEQIIAIAREIAGFTPGEADRLRRAMSSFRSQADMDRIGQQFVDKAVARGCAPDVAAEIFRSISAYAGYGFCEAHAASFADTAYKTTYLLEHYPAEFYAALLSHQPMGYYPANTLLWEAKRRGVRAVGVCVNESEETFTVDDDRTLRVGLGQVRQLHEKTPAAIVAARAGRPFASVEDFFQRLPALSTQEAQNLVLAGAFDALTPNRRALLWRLPETLRHAREARAPQARWQPTADDASPAEMNDFLPLQRDLREYYALGMTVNRHIVHHWRSRLRKRGAVTCAAARRLPAGHTVTVGGLCIRPHRPPTKSGRTVVFLTAEDETGTIDVTVFEDVYLRDGKDLFVKPLLLVSGRIEHRGDAVSVTAHRIEPFDVTPPR